MARLYPQVRGRTGVCTVRVGSSACIHGGLFFVVPAPPGSAPASASAIVTAAVAILFPMSHLHAARHAPTERPTLGEAASIGRQLGVNGFRDGPETLKVANAGPGRPPQRHPGRGRRA